ncbi:YecA family protein [Pseudomonas sp. MH9.3]|uniref:YecA family protein n=1 Tax=Pseudomonas sp. MH9.3 TaxID=3048630 RepID=UPI002AC99904|nr:SEC-C metal-binding domain-containing protein [Pseudomonas sp. MH9.3]MEB0108403.1 SEC-C metal-binding domain-containing protein [Pseudomonas sp. MH9.3]WPX81390.1 SEC-C metal-binding domain-containing protein [Pseudomonas sp. MH9.3]
MNMGRNELCWCGSGKKFKRCHLGRAAADPLKSWDISSAHRKSFSKRLCSAPDSLHDQCTSTIVSAHTVPRSGSLNQIADEGHVLTFIPTLESLIKYKGVLHPERVGVRKASTFTGFCSKHDDELFGPVEKEKFFGTQEQCFLLAYRAYAREIYTKRAAADQSVLHKEMDRGKTPDQQFEIQAFAFLHGAGIRAALRDINHHKPRFEKHLLSSDFADVRSYVIELENAPPVMCSATYAPDKDFEGQHLQDMADVGLIPNMMSVTSFYGGDKGQIVFTWLPDDDETCIPLIESLERVKDADISAKVVSYLFDNFENVHVSPIWWDSIGPDNQAALINRMTGEVGVAFGLIPAAKLPFRISPWPITRRYRVGC